MYTQNVTINNEVGLHARPATFFIQKANEFKSGIWLEKDERRVNAKSLLGVLSLGIVKGTTITLLADGADEPYVTRARRSKAGQGRGDGLGAPTRGAIRREKKRMNYSEADETERASAAQKDKKMRR